MAYSTPPLGWRFGEKYLVTEFIQNNNIAVKDLAEQLADPDPNKFFENVA